MRRAFLAGAAALGASVVRSMVHLVRPFPASRRARRTSPAVDLVTAARPHLDALREFYGRRPRPWRPYSRNPRAMRLAASRRALARAGRPIPVHTAIPSGA